MRGGGRGGVGGEGRSGSGGEGSGVGGRAAAAAGPPSSRSPEGNGTSRRRLVEMRAVNVVMLTMARAARVGGGGARS